MENTRLSDFADSHNTLHALHDRLTNLVSRANFELITLHLIGAIVLLEIIFSLHTSW